MVLVNVSALPQRTHPNGTVRRIEGKKSDTFCADWIDPLSKKRAQQRFKTENEAYAHLDKVGDKHYLRERDTLTVDDIIDQWLNVCEFGEDGRVPVDPINTLPTYKGEAKHIKQRFGKIKINELTALKLKEIRASMLKDEHEGKRLTRHMATRCLSRLKMAIRYAMSESQIVEDPCKGITIKKDKRDQRDRPNQPPEPSQALLILQTAEAMASDPNQQIRDAWRRYFPMVKTSMETGMRPSELRGLARRNLKLDELAIDIDQRADRQGLIGPPKTAAGNRRIYISQELADVIRAYLAFVPDSPDALVFANGNGRPDSVTNIRRSCWIPLLRRVGLTTEKGTNKHTLYSLRHFYASVEIALGATDKELQAQVGHANVGMTKDIYGHMFREREEGMRGRAANRWASLTGKPPEAPQPSPVEPTPAAADLTNVVTLHRRTAG